MQSWEAGPVPPRVGRAAAAHGLGALVTTAEAKQPTARFLWVGYGVGLLLLLVFNALVGRFGGGSMALLVGFEVVVFGGVYLLGRWARSGVTLYLFERGAVVDRPRRSQTRAVAWTEMAAYEYYQRLPGDSNGRWVLTLKVAGKAVFTCAGDDAVRLADVVSAIELVRARALLAAGRPVDYGVMRITREALVFERLTVPWANVTGMRAGRWMVRVLGDTDHSVLLPRQAFPHLRTVLALGEQLAAEARSAGRPA
jgi:hypothetical protein